MILLPILATAEDVERLARLEAEGKMPVGFTQHALGWSTAYVERILWLKLTGELPGCPSRSPKVFVDGERVFPVGTWSTFDQWKADPERVTAPETFWAKTYGRLQEIFGTK